MAADLAEFEATYRKHVSMVQAGDMAGVMADMASGAVPAVFTGVEVPRDAVSRTDIRDMRIEGERAVGECVYTTASGVIGLRSGWAYDGSGWKADALENFEA